MKTGTSGSNTVPRTKGFKKVAGSLSAPTRIPRKIAEFALSAALGFIPSGFVGLPVIYAASEGIRFVQLTKEEGIEAAIKLQAIEITLNYLVPSVSHELWKATATKLGPEFAGSPYGLIAEKAFKKTVSTVLSKGVKALEEEL